MAALFFAQARWDGNIGRESAALIESSLLSAALVPGRALHLGTVKILSQIDLTVLGPVLF